MCTALTLLDHETALPQTEVESETTLTIDQIAAQRRARSHAANRLDRPSAESDASLSSTDSPEALEDEAGQQGAFNEETGEINWDCPCLGGMAHGPCGEQFRNAFSCFVFSKEEPKGVDCIDKFKAMQDCFREHRDIYGAEIDDDEEPTNADDQAAMTETGVSLVSNNVDAKERPVDAEPSIAAGVAPQTGPDPKARDSVSQTHRVKSATAQVKHDHPAHQEDQTLVPKAWHDTRGEKGN